MSFIKYSTQLKVFLCFTYLFHASFFIFLSLFSFHILLACSSEFFRYIVIISLRQFHNISILYISVIFHLLPFSIFLLLFSYSTIFLGCCLFYFPLQTLFSSNIWCFSYLGIPHQLYVVILYQYIDNNRIFLTYILLHML